MIFLDICKIENRGKWFEMLSGKHKGDLCSMSDLGMFEFKNCNAGNGIDVNMKDFTVSELVSIKVSDTPYRKAYTLIEAVILLKKVYELEENIPVFENKHDEYGRVLSISSDGNVGKTYETSLAMNERFVWGLSVEETLGEWYLKE